MTRSNLLGRCPACKEAALYDGLLTIKERCENCDFNLSAHEKGDGPAFFVVTIMGALVCLLAVIVELLYMPPYWVHAVLWLPITIIGSLLCLRWMKSLMIAMQYRHQKETFNNESS